MVCNPVSTGADVGERRSNDAPSLEEKNSISLVKQEDIDVEHPVLVYFATGAKVNSSAWTIYSLTFITGVDLDGE